MHNITWVIKSLVHRTNITKKTQQIEKQKTQIQLASNRDRFITCYQNWNARLLYDCTMEIWHNGANSIRSMISLHHIIVTLSECMVTPLHCTEPRFNSSQTASHLQCYCADVFDFPFFENHSSLLSASIAWKYHISVSKMSQKCMHAQFTCTAKTNRSVRITIRS